MNIINSSYEIIEQKPGLQGILEQIELGARNCYKSEDCIKYDEQGNSLSAKPFVEKIVNVYKHQSVAEHGTVYLTIPYDAIMEYVDTQNPFDRDILTNPWTKYILDYAEDVVYISTNYRHILENNLESWLKYLCEPSEFHEKRVTVRFICDRGVSHELVRHRCGSFSQESTRYCNYSKDKFANELTFIIPSWAPSLQEGVLQYSPFEITEAEVIFMNNCHGAETHYLGMLSKGCTPQQARQVLPNALKTEVIMTAFVSDWHKIFALRCAENAHPDIRALMIPLQEEFNRRGYGS